MLNEQVEIGQLKYKISWKIGAGSCGTVYSVQCPQKKNYALKVIHSYGRDSRIKYMIDNQISTQSKLSDNPFIIRIYGHMQRHRIMYILLELGEFSLRNRIEMKTHIQLSEFLKICLDTTRALYSIHNMGIIHRDIKPQNIICVDKNYKITDFGSSEGGTVGDDYIGTPLYMPPELLNNEFYSRRLDVWSLGVSLFEAYFHIHPFFYLQGDDFDLETVQKQLKDNMSFLLPDFSMQRFLILINQKASKEKVKQVTEIIQVTLPELMQQFPIFFQNKATRPGIDYFLGAFISIQDNIIKQKRKQVKLKVKKEQLPNQIRFYVQTIELFYQLSSRYGSLKFNQVQLKFQLCVFYWSNFTYKNFKFMEYYQEPAIRKSLKDRVTLWREIKKVLFDYWCELSVNQNLEFFEYLHILRLRILICGARFNLLSSTEQQIKFYSKVQSIINPSLSSLEELELYFKAMEVRQIREIEDYLRDQYYLK